MIREYITEKKVGREFWYFAVLHSEMILNQVTGRLGMKLTTPFELVQNSKHDSKTWFGILSIRNFNRHINNIESRPKIQAHTLAECV